AETAIRSRAEGEDARPEDLKRRLARVARVADPVDRVFQQRGKRGVVFGAGDEDAGVGAHQIFELTSVFGWAGFGFDVAVIDRHRIVGEIGDVRGDVFGFRYRGAEACKPFVERVLADASG